jgi:RDD family
MAAARTFDRFASFLGEGQPAGGRARLCHVTTTFFGLCDRLGSLRRCFPRDRGARDLSMEAAARDDFGNISNDVLWKVARSVLALPVLLYFGFFLRTGHTLGMRALDFHVRIARTSRAPGLVRSAARACLAVVFVGAAYIAWFHLSTDPPGPEDPYRPYYWEPAHVTVVVAEWITLVAILGKLWSWFDRSGRSLWDHLFGIVFLERAEVSEEDSALSAWLTRARGRDWRCDVRSVALLERPSETLVTWAREA